jgi:hypothetical protein
MLNRTTKEGFEFVCLKCGIKAIVEWKIIKFIDKNDKEVK